MDDERFNDVVICFEPVTITAGKSNAPNDTEIFNRAASELELIINEYLISKGIDTKDTTLPKDLTTIAIDYLFGVANVPR